MIDKSLQYNRNLFQRAVLKYTILAGVFYGDKKFNLFQNILKLIYDDQLDIFRTSIVVKDVTLKVKLFVSGLYGTDLNGIYIERNNYWMQGWKCPAILPGRVKRKVH